MIKWDRVTWYSKLLAIIFFIGVLPLLCFYVGARYGEVKEQAERVETVSFIPKAKVAEGVDTSEWKTYRNEKYGFEFKYPESTTISVSSDGDYISQLRLSDPEESFSASIDFSLAKDGYCNKDSDDISANIGGNIYYSSVYADMGNPHSEDQYGKTFKIVNMTNCYYINVPFSSSIVKSESNMVNKIISTFKFTK